MNKKPIGYQPGKKYILDTKVPKNPKYQHIESKLVGKTGNTMKDVQIISQNNLPGHQQIAKRKGQNFKRIKPSILYKLLSFDTNVQSIYNLSSQNEKKNDIKSQVSVKSNVTNNNQHINISQDTQFILLDLREPEEYQNWHIKDSINFPGSNIRRDKMIPQLLLYEDKLIVLYHLDQKHGVQIAKEFFQKGFQNVFLVNGGIQSYYQKFPNSIQGKNVPMPIKKQGTNHQSVEKIKMKKMKDLDHIDKPVKFRQGDVEIEEDLDSASKIRSQFSKVSKKTNKKK